MKTLDFKVYLLASMLLVAASACSNYGKSNNGVAQVERDSSVVTARTATAVDSMPRSATIGTSSSQQPQADSSNLSDEEIVQRFVSCMRDQGLDLKDPVLRADGSIDNVALRQDYAQVASKVGKVKLREGLGACNSLLDGATFTQERTREDETKLKDNVLNFAQCLRDRGLDVKDPVFAEGNPRGSMRPLIANLTGPSSRVQKSVDECLKLFNMAANQSAGGGR